MFRGWQRRARFDAPYPFHSLRHTCLTSLLRESGGNLRVVQKVARHANIETTSIYTHPSDDEVMRAVKKLAS
jgi:site-specific recombinase XerD